MIKIPRILFQVGKLLTQAIASFTDEWLVDGFDTPTMCGILVCSLESTYHSALCANELTVYTEN